MSGEPTVPDSTPRSLDVHSAFRSTSLNTEAVQNFAQNTAENIIQSHLRQMERVEPEVDCQMSSFNQACEMLGEELSSAVIQAALWEVCRGPHNEEPQSFHVGVQCSNLQQPHHDAGLTSSRQAGKPSFLDRGGRERDASLNMNTELEDPSREASLSHDLPLSKSGLPVFGSLDYPDAPPTTPLLPELEKSRHSFSRKLKGGLAKEFLPSPPPPTPRDSESVAINDPRAELMEQLLQSLCEDKEGWKDDLLKDAYKAGDATGGAQHGATMEAFAEVLSANIVGSVMSAKSRKQTVGDSNVLLLADQLAEKIITSALDEASMIES
ncbi:uncharacterized protein si:dkey-171c9.3 [Thalassophryne amazonica]|uniref:uncharacterized protein si:dkey-171c9.3 n=1 Tax=Thalassophryne amazonica TaxID=390379 RepID=UPI0014717965|nr:uncharacterized protein si:dkey-171c9.3 [Thalassophryne amazonica]